MTTLASTSARAASVAPRLAASDRARHAPAATRSGRAPLASSSASLGARDATRARRLAAGGVASTSVQPRAARRERRRNGNARRAPTRACAASASAVAPANDARSRRPSKRPPAILAVALAVASALGWFLSRNTMLGQAAVAALAKSGFTAAFALIFVSELGDKTFFIAALLAMRLGRVVVLAGATSALGLMSVISVAIGRAFQQIPSAMTTSLPVGEYLAVALLLFFGVRTLKEALDAPECDADDAASCGGELADAEEAVRESEAAAGKRGGTGSERNAASRWLANYWETFTLVFIAEWGDRSMLATIALGAAQNPLGVATGATVGHLLATSIAVVGGALLRRVLYTGPHTTAFARWTPFLKDFSRRISPPTPRFQSPPSTPFNSN